MVNYQLSKIYRIVCNETGEQYIGATCQKKLCTRLAQHVSKKNCSSKGILERGNYSMLLIESYPCSSKDELHQRERYYIESLECVNKNIPTRTKKEWRQDNKADISEKQKIYRQDNKAEISEKQKIYRQDNKAEISEYKKIYHQKNKAEISERKKIYRQDNKAEISEKQKIYRQDNRNNKLEYDKNYRQINRDIINNKKREKRQAIKLTPEDHRAKRREYWQSKKESQKVPLSQPE